MNLTIHIPSVLEAAQALAHWASAHPIWATVVALWLGVWVVCSGLVWRDVHESDNPWWMKAFMLACPLFVWLLEAIGSVQ